MDAAGKSSPLSHSRRGSLQKIRRSVVDSATGLQASAGSRKSGLGHARNESKEILLTDLELWTALVSDYTQTAIRLPILTSRKIRAGIPQPLRGLVWQAMSGARDTHLEGLYETLSAENTPFEKVIGRDLARTFPQVEMFREEGGAGQLDLGKVLRAFSLYDAEVGYCQGLGFLVAPLLMNMAHSEAFCVLARMMENYGIRSMYTPTLSGLKLRLFQFESLLDRIVPGIASHLTGLGIFPAMYASQWFLSLFAVTCPLETLHRLYDLMLAEGIPECMMRLAVTLLVKNQEAIMTLDMEDVLHLLLSSDLWAVYGMEDDLLINDVVSFNSSITTDGLTELEKQYETGHEESNTSQVKSLQSVTASFLGRINPTRLFSGSFSAAGNVSSTGSNSVDMSRTSSKMSNISLDSASVQSSCTENPDDAYSPSFARSSTHSLKKHSEALERENRQLNRQIEDLIEALSESHREVVVIKEQQDELGNSLDDFKTIATELLRALAVTRDSTNANSTSLEAQQILEHFEEELATRLQREPMSTSAQVAAEKVNFLETQLDDRNHEVGRMRLSLQSVKAALEATQREKVKLEKALNDVRLRKEKGAAASDVGLRELKLGRPASAQRTPSQTRSDSPSGGSGSGSGPPKAFRRASTFTSGMHSPSAPSSPDLTLSGASSGTITVMTAHEEEVDSLRLELVQAKALVAIAQQEAEEAKYALRMARGAATKDQGTHGKRLSVTRAETAPAASLDGKTTTTTGVPASSGPSDKTTPTASSATTGGWFWKR